MPPTNKKVYTSLIIFELGNMKHSQSLYLDDCHNIKLRSSN